MVLVERTLQRGRAHKRVPARSWNTETRSQILIVRIAARYPAVQSRLTCRLKDACNIIRVECAVQPSAAADRCASSWPAKLFRSPCQLMLTIVIGCHAAAVGRRRLASNYSAAVHPIPKSTSSASDTACKNRKMVWILRLRTWRIRLEREVILILIANSDVLSRRESGSSRRTIRPRSAN